MPSPTNDEPNKLKSTLLSFLPFYSVHSLNKKLKELDCETPKNDKEQQAIWGCHRGQRAVKARTLGHCVGAISFTAIAILYNQGALSHSAILTNAAHKTGIAQAFESNLVLSILILVGLGLAYTAASGKAFELIERCGAEQYFSRSETPNLGQTERIARIFLAGIVATALPIYSHSLSQKIYYTEHKVQPSSPTEQDEEDRSIVSSSSYSDSRSSSYSRSSSM
ncbi:MAG: hypothetical protein QM752_01935 [Gammaproteobacteria bacterium]